MADEASGVETVSVRTRQFAFGAGRYTVRATTRVPAGVSAAIRSKEATA
jgi:hypothetical protein